MKEKDEERKVVWGENGRRGKAGCRGEEQKRKKMGGCWGPKVK